MGLSKMTGRELGLVEAIMKVGSDDVSATNPVPIKGGTVANTTKISPTCGSKTVTTAGTAVALVAASTLRTMLYMPALVSIRYDTELGKVYKALSSAGKPAKVAITAVMRKLIVLANALIRDDRKWAQTAP